MSDNRMLAKNTIYLYIRMLLVMVVSLYTSRVVLDALGIVDFGIYNVVGSVVALFAFLQKALGNASHRFIAYALGKNENEYLKKIFSTSVELHFLIALVIIILSETVGLWFFYNKLVIPPERMSAAMIVLQFSIVSSCLSICTVPYTAEIIAHEKMQFYAVISIAEVVIKLGVAFLLVLSPFDKLVLYGFLILISQIILFLVHVLYCRHFFFECHFQFVNDKGMFKEMTSFAGWNVFGHISTTLSVQGRNMLLNMYFGPALNAAKGVAQQVEGAVMSFVQNILTAVGPQITKSYAADNNDRMFFLVFISTKVSFVMYIILALPLFLEIDTVLSLWLVEVPPHTASFLRLVLISHLSSSFFQPLNKACMATGKAGLFLGARGIVAILILVLSYILFKMGFEPESMYIAEIIMLYISVFISLAIVSPMIKMSKRQYFIKTILRLTITLVVAAITPMLICIFMPATYFRLFLVVIISSVSVLAASFFIGLEAAERKMFVNFIREKVSNKKSFNKKDSYTISNK